jgi:hypothetical protein
MSTITDEEGDIIEVSTRLITVLEPKNNHMIVEVRVQQHEDGTLTDDAGVWLTPDQARELITYLKFAIDKTSSTAGQPRE